MDVMDVMEVGRQEIGHLGGGGVGDDDISFLVS